MEPSNIGKEKAGEVKKKLSREGLCSQQLEAQLLDYSH